MIENKIFVVILVFSTILIALAGYLFWLERRIKKMEKQIENDRKNS